MLNVAMDPDFGHDDGADVASASNRRDLVERWILV
jgi:hypothetical protein